MKELRNPNEVKSRIFEIKIQKSESEILEVENI
jgi:hypothetical protein